MQEIAQQGMAVFGQNRFGMELYAFNRQGFMTEPHDFIETAIGILRPGGDFKTIRQGFAFNHQ